MSKLFFSLISMFLGIMILFGTFFLLFSRDPELTYISSADGRVFLEGDFRAEQNPSIELTDLSVFDGYGVYQVTPDGLDLESSARLGFSLVDKRAVDVVLLWFDDSFDFWQQVDSIVQMDEQVVVAEVNTLGLFTLVNLQNTDVDFDPSVFDQLLLLAPEGTVGFRLAAAYDIDGDFLEIPTSERFGGCGRVIQRGDTQQFTRINVDDVVYAAEWFISSFGGCREGEGLE